MVNEPQSQSDGGSFDRLSEKLVAHPSKSQILVEVASQGNTLERALHILEKVDMKPIHQEHIKRGGPECVLMLLPSEDMKEAVLKLTEAGFTKVKGINAESHYPGKGSGFRISPSEM